MLFPTSVRHMYSWVGLGATTHTQGEPHTGGAGLVGPHVWVAFDGCGEALSENLIQPWLEPAAATPSAPLYLLGGSIVKLWSPFHLVEGSPGESPAPVRPERATSAIFSSLPPWRHYLGGPTFAATTGSLAVLPCRLDCWMSGHRGDGACMSRWRP
jgi:hypothetical protein